MSRIFWWFREIVAVVVWAGFFIKTLVFDFDLFLVDRFAPKYAWLMWFKVVPLLIFAAALLTFAKKSWWKTWVMYVAFYPFVLLLARLPILLFKNWPIAIAFAPAIYGYFSTFRLNFLFFAVTVISCFAIALSSNAYIIAIAIFLLFAYLGRRYFREFRRAYLPSSVFADLTQGVVLFRVAVVDKVLQSGLVELQKIPEGTPEFEKARQSKLQTVYVLLAGLRVVAYKFRRLAGSRHLDIYLLTCVFANVLVTAVVFAFQYWGLQKVNAANFSPPDLTYWDFLGFSFSTLTTSGISQVRPVGVHASIFAHVESMCSWLIIGLLLSILLDATRERLRADLDKMVDNLDQFGSAIALHLESGYQITEESIEMALLDSSLALINWMRRQRGLAELKPPEATREPSILTAVGAKTPG